MTRHRDPQDVLQSLQQPISLGDDNAQSDSKPFSIRDYVCASRQKDIVHSWPFPEKNLQMFINHGIETVLPPFEPHHLALQSLTGRVSRCLNDPRQQQQQQQQQQHKEENVSGGNREPHRSGSVDREKISDETVSEICISQRCHQDQSSDFRVAVHPCNGVVASSTKRVAAKRNKGKGKHKKKSIVDILDAVRPCTSSQNLQRRRSLHGLSKSLEVGSEQNCDESELTEDQFLENRVLQEEDCEGTAIDLFRGKKMELKFKFKGRTSLNSRSRNLKRKGMKVLRLHK